MKIKSTIQSICYAAIFCFLWTGVNAQNELSQQEATVIQTNETAAPNLVGVPSDDPHVIHGNKVGAPADEAAQEQ